VSDSGGFGFTCCCCHAWLLQQVRSSGSINANREGIQVSELPELPGLQVGQCLQDTAGSTSLTLQQLHLLVAWKVHTNRNMQEVTRKLATN